MIWMGRVIVSGGSVPLLQRMVIIIYIFTPMAGLKTRLMGMVQLLRTTVDQVQMIVLYLTVSIVIPHKKIMEMTMRKGIIAIQGTNRQFILMILIFPIIPMLHILGSGMILGP